MSPQMIFTEAKKTDIVPLLAQLGFIPVRVVRQDYWYRSPFREERTASFKVNRERNIFFDHGEGIGGNIIDFAARFFRCDAQTAAEKILELNRKSIFSFHRQHSITPGAGEKKERAENRITILDARPIQKNVLLSYLQERKIPLKIARQYCKEVDFLLYEKLYTAIGFENKSGGFELRSATFKGSSSPKDVTFLDNGKQEICAFEGFFDFLSFAVIQPQAGAGLTNCLVLNSLSFFEKSRSLMEEHNKVILFLDRGKAGRQNTQNALTWNKEFRTAKYTDGSELYKYRDDLNDWLVAQSRQHQQQIQKHGRRI